MRNIPLIAMFIALLCVLWAGLSSAAYAKVTCQPPEQLKALTETTNAKPIFLAQGADPDFSYVIVGDSNTGEWIAFVISKKLDKACNVANGVNFSIVAAPEEPKK